MSVTCQFAVHAQETGLAAEKPQVCQTGLQPGRQMAVFLSGYPAKVHFRLSGRRSTLNLPLFQMIANQLLNSTIYRCADYTG